MQRTVNLLIGLAVLVGVSVILFGAMGGSNRSAKRAPAASSQRSDRFAVPQLEAATSIAGRGASQPPPIPATAAFTERPLPSRLAAVVNDPSHEARDRGERAMRRAREIFGGSLGEAKEAAIEEAIATWVAMQAQALSAFYGGYLDSASYSEHTAWNRNVYLFALQDILGNDDYQRFAGGGVELDEVSPL
jgi:hypothetical protein